MEVSNFNEKLNKLDGKTYVIEEECTLNDGIYEAELAHDNITISTLNVYTGSKLTGDKINTYITSTPSLTPWKIVIKIYSNVSTLYISYETTGDQIEADDINNVQGAIVDTQTALNNEVDRAINREDEINFDFNLYKTTNDSEIQGLKSKDMDLDNNKADLSYVSTELGNRYIKDQVFTKDEVLQKISDLIGTSPQTLDTFKEIADALGNDPNFATTIINSLSNKVDKVEGKQLSTNDYSNTEKATLVDVNSKKHEHLNKSIIDTITQTLIDNWNVAYTHISDAVKHITSTERTNWNTAYTNNHTHTNKSVLDGITSALITNWNSAFSHISDTIKHITSDERTLWNTVSNKLDSTANAVSASKLATPRTISVTGDVTGSTSFDGSGNASITATVVDDSHNHTSSTITDFLATVRSTVLTGLSTATNLVISGTDTVLGALGKLQAQITANLNSLTSHTGNISNPHSTTANQVGLGNVTNDSQVKRSEMGVANGVATLDSLGVNNQPPKTHTHTKSQITDMPSEISEFTNDVGYITATDVDTSQNHIHSNKSVLDSITQTLINTWNTVTNKVDKVTGKSLILDIEITRLASVTNYTHPSTHAPSIIAQDASNRFTTDAEKTNWNGKLNSTANAVSASKFATARTIAITGDVTGSATFDGSSNVSITATLKNGLTWNDLEGV